MSAPTEEARAANVIEALSRVVRDLPGIGKNDDSSQGYKYRGIEAITRETQGLLGKHGVVFVPNVMTWETEQLTVNNRPWTDTKLTVLYRVYGPGGVEDRIEVGPIAAIGRDNSDKGANKAMTQAFKYALLQTLCISDATDDGDQATHEADEQHNAPDRAACPSCGEFIAGALSDKEPMRAHMVREHTWVRRDDGTVAPPEAKDYLAVVDTMVDKSGAESAEPQVSGTEPVDTTKADPGFVSRIVGRLDNLPDELRRQCEDVLAVGFDGRFPHEITTDDVADLSATIADFEARVPPTLADRAAKKARDVAGPET